MKRSELSESEGGDDVNAMLVNGSPARNQLVILQARLSSAMESLRAQCGSRSTDVSQNSSADESPATHRKDSLTRTRELNKQLIQSRTREADLQDEVDALKGEISEYKYRISEVESIVDEWRSRYEVEAENSKKVTSDLEMRIFGLRMKVQELMEEKKSILDEKDSKIHDLHERWKDAQNSSRLAPVSPKASSMALSSSYIPDICESFRAAQHALPVFHF